ncbi:hypothetical protein A4A49_55128 [Nicotiana attenuata]|uniref:Uncharacterized protein n=1 Tax=Nicotiana attenuata TaxID=49451 RepID=A0A1J6IG27_NICAT|nr:hypothetical protein A4A49_55128 [Nicotiana attenuata]
MGNLSEEFDRNYLHVIIHDMIDKLREIVDDESSKGCQNLKVFLDAIVVFDQDVDKRNLFEESSRFHGMVPTSKSSMEFPERMEVDGECMIDNCVIWLEKTRRREEDFVYVLLAYVSWRIHYMMVRE